MRRTLALLAAQAALHGIATSPVIIDLPRTEPKRQKLGKAQRKAEKRARQHARSRATDGVTETCAQAQQKGNEDVGMGTP